MLYHRLLVKVVFLVIKVLTVSGDELRGYGSVVTFLDGKVRHWHRFVRVSDFLINI